MTHYTEMWARKFRTVAIVTSRRVLPLNLSVGATTLPPDECPVPLFTFVDLFAIPDIRQYRSLSQTRRAR